MDFATDYASDMHHVLKRQLGKHLGPKWEDRIPAPIRPLLEAVSETYNNFDEDRKLTERSFDLSTEEISESSSLIRSALESTRDGILVVDREGRITLSNERFVEMWNIPQGVMEKHDDATATDAVLTQLKDPDGFVRKVRELYAAPEEVSVDLIEFKDGRIFERLSQPQKIRGKTIGRVWNFRDVTERRKHENAILDKKNELEKMLKLMVGRELRMAELKRTIKELRETKTKK